MADERQQSGRDDEAQPAAGAPNADRPAWEAAPANGEMFGTPFDQEPLRSDAFPPLVEFGPEADSADARPWARAVPPEHRPLLRLSELPYALLHMWDPGRLSRVQKILVTGILINALAVLYVLLARGPAPLTPDRVAPAPSSGGDQTPPPQARMGLAAREPAAVAPSASIEAGVQDLADSQRDSPRLGALPGPEPLSLQLADKLYLRRDFEHAQAMYEKLHRRLLATEDHQPLRDFLLLRMALCGKNSGNVAQADALLRTVSLSRLPILRALARYHQSTTLLSRQRYLEATAKAYQAIALIEVAAHDKKWTSAVQRQCGFLAAEAMTRNLLSLCDADANLPRELWSEPPDIDPFVDMDEPQLRVFLASGADQIEAAVLSPQIRPVQDKTAVPHWSVICNGAPIEELLARFAANAGVNIRWTDPGQATATPAAPLRVGGEDNVRARPVHLYLTSATTTQVVTTAAGSVGLIARVQDQGVLQLLDPTWYSSLADHTSLLAEEAITLWQRFLLAAESDPRAANAHFALALLQAARGQFDQATAEYKLVANRFAMHALAPYALLQSGLLKVRLRDYVGAHTDLKQLIELYPETELSDRACLHLADATMKAGLYEEASGWYRKVYNLGLSAAAQTESAWGAGRCLYETGRYAEAAEWLNRYTAFVRDRHRPPFAAACLLLGQAYLALHQPSQAQAALRLALRGELSRQQHVQTITVLVKTYLEQGLFLEALGVLENAGGWQLSQQEAVELALLRAQALRSIGLAEKAIGLLQEKSQYLPNPELQAKVALELARCQIAGDHPESARQTLGPVFEMVEPGPLADQIGRELALVCLHLGQTEQAVSVCSLLQERAAASERPALLALLADAYRRQGKLDQAMAATLNQYEVAADPNAALSIRNN
jgi:tetratricopeptide (TPR) repeat protein